MYKTILVPIDLSHPEPGKAMIDVAKQIAGEGSTITLVHVVEGVPPYVAIELPEGIVEKSVERAREALGKIARDAGLEGQIEVRVGGAYQTILDIATERKADLIIVGSHRPGLQDYLIGSTAARIVRHATCAVLVQR